MISGRSAGASQPSQEANTGRNGIEIAPRTWLAAKRSTGRASMRTAPSANRGPHFIHAQRCQRRLTVQQRRADAVDLTEPAEVRRIAAQRAEKLCHESVFVGGL